MRLRKTRSNRATATIDPIPQDPELHQEMHAIENCLASPKDWQWVEMRCGRCPVGFLPACAPVVIVIFWF